VSPFRPFLPPQLGVFSQLPTIHCSLSTLLQLSPLSTAFLPRAKPRGTPTRAVSPLVVAFTTIRPLAPLSTAFTQTHRGVGAQDSLWLGVSVAIDFLTLCFHDLPNPFSRNSFPCTSIQNPRGVTPSTNSIFTLTPLDSYTPLFTLDFALRTKYCIAANCCSQERGL